MKWTSRIYKFFIDILYPNRCPVCDSFIGYDKLICEKCIKQLPYIEEEYCIKCGKHDCICGKHKIYYDKCLSFIYYEGKGKDGIMNLKLKCGINFAEYFAEKAVTDLDERGLLSQIDFITATPTTKGKLQERGYNQAFEFAKHISKLCDIKASENFLVKTDSELNQHELSSAERKSRSFKAYALSSKAPSLSGKTILLCDDVITTGSTLNACAKILKKAGAERVICVAIANTNHYSKNKN